MLCMTFGDEALNQTTVFEWHSNFKISCHLSENDKYSDEKTVAKQIKMWKKKLENSYEKIVI